MDAGLLLAAGHPLPAVADCLGRLRAVPGRLEPVDRGQGFEVLVDYAHTPSSFEAILPPLAERVSGERLSDLLRREVTRPLGISAQATAAPTASRAVECELDGRREVALAAALGVRVSRPRKTFRGEPQDSNARRLARLAGHAGLFVTPEALLALALAWLRPETWLGAGAVQRALGGPRGGYAIGWARRSRAGSSGLALSPRSFGHTGFTGGSLWVDPERELAVALTAHRRSTAIDLNPLRRDLHAWAVERWGRAGGGRSATGVR